jgi:uncharacterized membrane protein YkoI
MRSAKGVQAIGMLAMAAMLAFAPMAIAKHGDHAETHESSQAKGISKDQAIEIAQHRYKARVVRAETSESDGRRFYVLRLLSDEGRVWTVRIDAQTGNEF